MSTQLTFLPKNPAVQFPVRYRDFSLPIDFAPVRNAPFLNITRQRVGMSALVAKCAVVGIERPPFETGRHRSATRDLWKAAVCEHPTLVSGDIIKLAVPRPWAFIGTISTPKEPLFSEPSVDQKTKAYLVKDDPVAILVLNGKSQISNNGFQQIDYLGGAHELIRWVKDGPVYYHVDR